MTALRLTAIALLAAVAALTTPAIAQKATTKPAETQAATAKPKSSTKKPSACKGLAESTCTTKTECGWIKPKKKISKSGRTLTPYCRKIAGIAKKKSK